MKDSYAKTEKMRLLVDCRSIAILMVISGIGGSGMLVLMQVCAVAQAMELVELRSGVKTVVSRHAFYRK